MRYNRRQFIPPGKSIIYRDKLNFKMPEVIVSNDWGNLKNPGVPGNRGFYYLPPVTAVLRDMVFF